MEETAGAPVEKGHVGQVNLNRRTPSSPPFLPGAFRGADRRKNVA